MAPRAAFVAGPRRRDLHGKIVHKQQTIDHVPNFERKTHEGGHRERNQTYDIEYGAVSGVCVLTYMYAAAQLPNDKVEMIL